MKIAVFGDSKVSEDQHKLALKYNPNLSQQDIDNTWINRLRADGHTVDVFSRMSCDNHWINTKWQDMYNRADDRNKSYYGYDRWIIRPAPVNSLPFNVSDEDFNKSNKPSVFPSLFGVLASCASSSAISAAFCPLTPLSPF